jgi:hypothetical protein
VRSRCKISRIACQAISGSSVHASYMAPCLSTTNQAAVSSFTLCVGIRGKLAALNESRGLLLTSSPP